jgi:hypothetical protein
MTQHTPEPWKVDNEWPCSIVDSTDISIIECWDEGDNGNSFEPYDIKATEENARANARRIVACVNACAGIVNPDIKIPKLQEALIEAVEQLQKAEQQRDELLDLLTPFLVLSAKLECCNSNYKNADSQKVWGVDGAWLTLGDFRAIAKAQVAQS